MRASSQCGGREVRPVSPKLFPFRWAYTSSGTLLVFTGGGEELKASSPWGGRQVHPTFSLSGGRCLATRKGPSCGLFPVSADTAILLGSRNYESEDAFAVSYGVTFSSVESGDRGTWLVLGPCSSDDTCAGEIP